MGRRWGVSLAGVALVALVLLPACGLEHKRPDPDDDTSDFSADRLDLNDDEDPFFDQLDPAERKALERSGLAKPQEADPDDAAPEPESKTDKASKISLSVLSVAMTIGAAVAPFLLF